MSVHYRSGFESRIGQDLNERGIEHGFETVVLSYTSTVRGGSCLECGSKKVGKARKYTPDFIIPRAGHSTLYVEAKGRLPSTDRSKMRDVKKAWPDLDIRFLFQRRSKVEMTKLINWCEKNGFACHFEDKVPEHWL